MMESKEPRHINEIVQSFFKSRNWRQRVDGYNFFDSWEDILPPEIALNTKPLKIQNNNLFLMVKNHIWASEIVIRKGEIINILNQEIGQNLIENIIIKINSSKFIDKP